MNHKIIYKIALLLIVATTYSYQNMDRKPIELSEITEGGFFLKLNGSWSYIQITDSVISEYSRVNRVGEDSVVRTWQRLAFHQIIYDTEKDSVFRLTARTIL